MIKKNNFFRNKKLIAYAIFFLNLFAINANAETLKEAVITAIETNPDVQSNYHLFKSSQHEITIARAGYKPSVDLSASVGKASRDYDGRGSYNTAQGEVSLTQYLFTGFKTSSEVSYFSSANKVRFFELIATAENIAFETVRAYEDVYRTRQLVALARDNYAKHQEVFSQIEERTLSGVGRAVDLEQVGGRVALAETNLLTEASNLHDVTARYLRVVGSLPAQDFVRDENLLSVALPESIQQMLTYAYQGNPAFKAAVENINAANARVKSSRSAYYPQAALRARQLTNKNVNSFDQRTDPDRFGDESAVELNLTYNLYAGGANKAAVRKSLEDVNFAKDERNRACVDLRQDAQISYNDSHRIAEILNAMRQHELSSDKVRSAYYDQFNIGQRSLLDLLDAENEYFQATRATVIAEGDLLIAHSRALASMGQLLVSLGISREGLEIFSDESNLSLDVKSDYLCPDISPSALTRGDLIHEMSSLSADALFAVGSSLLLPAAKNKLDVVVSRIKEFKDVVSIRIEGHTDATGNDAINVPLSHARANAVRDYLILNGLDSIPMTSNGYGAGRPVASNETDEGRASNRRVEIEFSRTIKQ